VKIRPLFLLADLFLLPLLSPAGTWSPVANTAPSTITTMLLLTDGTVMAQDNGNKNWYKLTPNASGSYINGTWYTLAPMHDSRLYYSSDVMMDGRVFVAGGEYGSGSNTCEIYDPPSNTWTPVTNVIGGLFYDSDSKMLPNGNVLVAPVFPTVGGTPVIFNTVLNTFVQGPPYVRGFYQDEASWVKLPDDSMLTIDPFGENSERYIPSLNKWVNDADATQLLYDSQSEMGAAFLLPNGNAFYIGAASHTELYIPSGSTNMGSWTAGPDIPGGLGAPDAPAAMMANGKILCAFGPSGTFDGPTSFYEYDYASNVLNAVGSPNGITYSPFTTRMLDLPDGTVLFSWQSSRLYVYTPDGSPLAQGKPIINSIITNSDGSYRLTGLQLNGISEGAAYGDDAQMDSDYPIIRMTNTVSGNVYYARTYDWSSFSVMASNTVSTTEFTVPNSVPAGTYSLVAVANGIASDPVTFAPGTASPNTIPLTNSDTVGNASFNTGLNWTDSLAPAGMNNYLVSGLDLRTPQTNSDLVFQGGSLFLTNSGALRITTTGNGNVITVGLPPGRAMVMSDAVVSDWAGQPEILNGYVTLINSNNIFDPQNTTLTIASVISGGGSLTIDSPNGTVGGNVILVRSNTYTGGTVLNAADTLQFTGSGTAGPASASLAISNTFGRGFGWVDLHGTAQTIGNLVGTGGIITNRVSTAGNLTIGSGSIANANGSGAGIFLGGITSSSTRAVNLTKAGAGTLTLGGNSSVKNLNVGLNNSSAQMTNGTFVVSGVSLGVGYGTNDSINIASGNFTGSTLGTLDVSAASNFTANVGNFLVSVNASTSGSVPAWAGALNLGTNNTIFAGRSFVIGDSANAAGFSSLLATLTTAPNGITAIQTPSLVLGGRKCSTTFSFGSGAVFKVGVTTNRTAMGVGNAGALGLQSTSVSFTSSNDFSAGTFVGVLSNLVVGTINNSSSGNETGILVLGTNAANHLDITGPGNTVIIGKNFLGGGAGTATGTLTISNLDATSVVSSTDNSTAVLLAASLQSTGTLNLNGGTLTIASTSADIAGGGGTSTLNLNGVTLKAAASSTAFITNLTTARINPGGVIFDTVGFNITVAQVLSDGGGSLTKINSGKLTLSRANLYTGNTSIGTGTLALIEPGSLASSAIISVSNNATLDVTGRTDQTLTVGSGKILQGSGTIIGKLSASANSTIFPGDAIGTLTISSNVTLAGTVVMELNRTNGVTNDKLVSSNGTIAGGGTLTVTNLGPALQLGDTFQVFNPPVSGFTTVILPDVSPNIWNNKVSLDGTIQVIVPVSTAPVNVTMQATNSSLSLSWPSDHIGWRLQSQTNSIVGTNWADVAGANATNQVLIPIDLLNTCVFFRLVYP